MGLLDDAIREHLELKRRHGASEKEVSQLEDEAFGAANAPAPVPPPARPAAPAPAAEQPPGAPDDDEDIHEPEEDLAEDAGFDVPPPREPREPEPDPPPVVPPPELPDEPLPEEDLAEDAGFDVPPPSESSAPAAFTDSEPWLDEPDEVPAGDALEHEPEIAARSLSEIEEDEPGIAARSIGDVEAVEEEEAEAEGDAEDVLEETPDFLQDTPEHDRLWFEQKPPRDFDL
jgi:hypothetical protein